MGRNKKVKLLIALLILFIICIFSLGHSTEDLYSSDDAGWKLPKDEGKPDWEHNFHLDGNSISLIFDDEERPFTIKHEDGTTEQVTLRASDYRKYFVGVDGPDGFDGAIDSWDNAANENILDLKEEGGAVGTVELMYKDKPGAPTADFKPDEWVVDQDGGYHTTNWTIRINVAVLEKKVKNEDGTYTYKYDDLSKVLTIVHELGHLIGASDLYDIDSEESELPIMYFQKMPNKAITEKDILVAEICNGTHIHEFGPFTYYDDDNCMRECPLCKGYEKILHQFAFALVPVGTKNLCQKSVKTCSRCGYQYITYDITHTYTDIYDPDCNDCGYIRAVTVIEKDGLLIATIDGETWTICYPGAGPEFPDTVKEIHYKSSYNGITWADNGSIGTFSHTYCYRYGGTNYYLGYRGEGQGGHEISFFHLIQIFETEKDGVFYNLKWIRVWRYDPQYIQTNYECNGGFYWNIGYNYNAGKYYIELRRVLICQDGTIVHYNSVWVPPLCIPIKFDTITNIYRWIRKIVDVISAYGEVVKSVNIDEFNNTVKFILKWPGSDLDLTLKMPDGTIVNPELAQTDPNIEYTEEETSEYYTVNDPMVGEWQMIVDAVDVTGEETYTLEVLGESPDVTFNVSTDKSEYTYPESVLVKASVIAVDHVVGADVTGTVARPDGSNVGITLYDNGLASHGDEYQDDGIYSNYFSDYSSDGIYTFDMMVENTDGVVINPPEMLPQPVSPFTREAIVSVTVSGL